MSGVMIVPYENRLSKLVREPGGMKISDALEQAAKNLEDVRDDCLTVVDERLADIMRLCEDAPAVPTAEISEQIYQCANEINSLAGVFSLRELGEAAFSLCELVDRLRMAGRWNKAAVGVHLSALRLLRHPDESTDRAAVLEGLRQVTALVPKQPAED